MTATVCALLAAMTLGSDGSDCATVDDPALDPRVFDPLPLGQIKPSGWLRNQLLLQADGLSGHLDEFWPDIQGSAWFGGSAEGWERVPYWLDGLVPLAYLLDDKDLQNKVKRAVDYILEHQHDDGWLGPVGDNNPRHKPYDVWPLFPLFKAFIQYQEATADPRVVPALMKCAKKIDQVITKEPLYSWAHFRAADFVVCLYWLHERTGEGWLLELARKALSQAYDWRAHFEHFDEKYKEKTTKFGLDNHGVNNGMALKFGGMCWRLSGNAADRDLAEFMLEKLDRHHGQPNGMFTCDEHYAGRSPSQGTELCTVVEAMYSLEQQIAVTGRVPLADRLEKIAFNALPATFKKDLTAHQYDQQCNQVICTAQGEHVYVNNGPDSNLYGLEPNFGCCTANMHQGWPKFASSVWMSSIEGGLAAISYAPCEVKTELHGKPVAVEVKTDYPFRDIVRVKVSAPPSVAFPLLLRAPAWCDKAHFFFKNATGSIDGEKFEATADGHLVTKQGGEFVRIESEWGEGTTIVLQFDCTPRLYHGCNDSVAIERGPILFALNVEAEWKRVKDRPDIPFDDWEVLPKSAWNYALGVDADNLSAALQFERRAMTDRPFAPESAPLEVKVKGRKLPGWTLERNAAAPPPQSPVQTNEPVEELTLIPYGCTDLRVTEFPWYKP